MPRTPQSSRTAPSAHKEELIVDSIAFGVVGGLGTDTSDYSIPYLTSWSDDDASLEIVESCAEIIDRLAKRIEEAIGDPPNPTATSEPHIEREDRDWKL